MFVFKIVVLSTNFDEFLSEIQVRDFFTKSVCIMFRMCLAFETNFTFASVITSQSYFTSTSTGFLIQSREGAMSGGNPIGANQQLSEAHQMMAEAGMLKGTAGSLDGQVQTMNSQVRRDWRMMIGPPAHRKLFGHPQPESIKTHGPSEFRQVHFS